jgi:hypothetical protein
MVKKEGRFLVSSTTVGRVRQVGRKYRSCSSHYLGITCRFLHVSTTIILLSPDFEDRRQIVDVYKSASPRLYH